MRYGDLLSESAYHVTRVDEWNDHEFDRAYQTGEYTPPRDVLSEWPRSVYTSINPGLLPSSL